MTGLSPPYITAVISESDSDMDEDEAEKLAGKRVSFEHTHFQ